MNRDQYSVECKNHPKSEFNPMNYDFYVNKNGVTYGEEYKNLSHEDKKNIYVCDHLTGKLIELYNENKNKYQAF